MAQTTAGTAVETFGPQATVNITDTALPAVTAVVSTSEVATDTPVATTAIGTPVVIVPPTGVAISPEASWQAQQANRQDFGEERRYMANGAVPLLWFDPATGQSLEIGRLVGRFVATAQFELRFQNNAGALAVPYTIDVDYGLTAISPAVKARMQAAGYTERVEAYVLLSDVITLASVRKPEQIDIAAFDILLAL